MGLKRRLEYIFLIFTLLFLALLGYNLYSSYIFKHDPLPKSYLMRIENKEKEVLKRMQESTTDLLLGFQSSLQIRYREDSMDLHPSTGEK